MKRYLTNFIQEDLRKKMVFIGGPRQVGKTTLAIQFLDPPDTSNSAYLNWDEPRIRKDLMAGILPADMPIIIFDEIHKYKAWRNLVKGYYDTRKSKTSFIVTGSARLDYYRKGGDSLLGRYFYYRLHPFSLFEMNNDPKPDDLRALLEFGGFPEMLLGQNVKDWKRWQKERATQVIRDDLLSLEQVRDVTQLELLASLLETKVSALLSVQSLCEDLGASHEAVTRWIMILENVYFCYRLAPYGSPKIKALKKEQKLYLWDWSSVENIGARFENLVASHLLKFCHFKEDTEGEKMELRFLRDKEKREIDFVVIQNKKPLFAVECKTGDKGLNPHFKYFAERTPIPLFYQVHQGASDFEMPEARARSLPFVKFAREVLKV